LSCHKGLLYNLPSEPTAPGIWPFEETKRRRAIAHKYFVLQVGDFNGISYPDNFFDFILITGVPSAQFSLAKVFEEVDRVLKPQGELCFSLSQEQEGLAESIIYYGMESGFVFITRGPHYEEHRKSRKGIGTSLYLTLNESLPNHEKKITSKRTEETAIWFCKGVHPAIVWVEG
jgi:ubiquinone/menaquinone biosynthesis C-methylase UbiE